MLAIVSSWLLACVCAYFKAKSAAPPSVSLHKICANFVSQLFDRRILPTFSGRADNLFIIDFKGHSYFIYRNGGLPVGGSFRRSVCAEYLNYNPDGTIQHICETAEGISQGK
ncbi:MAG: hypothetical protein JO117_03520 [Verrucomicrobia bacterium]|nr:hypothetical protein [Verrucomicrobiota bacterium]